MKRSLAFILALVILVGMLPMNAFATEEASEATEATETTEVTEATEATEAVEEIAVSETEDEHTHEYTAEVTDPTCTEQGYTTYTCDCIDSYEDDYVDATGEHIYENGICTMCGDEDSTIYDAYLQELPPDFCSGTDLWTVLEPINLYYTASGWGNSSKSVYSVTFPVTAGDRIYATSFRAAGENGFPEKGVRITWFNETGVLESLHRDTVYAEFTANGYITVPEGAVAVNVPMIDNADTWEIYILNREHNYDDGICTACGAEYPNVKKYQGKVISILGDSISTFAGYIPTADGFNLEHLSRYPDADRIPDVTEAEQTWWMQVITELDAKLGVNDSWRGAMVSGASAVTTGSTGPNAAMSNLQRIRNLGANGTPDVILFYGGTNDYAHLSAIGTFDPASAPVEADLTTTSWNNLADAYVQTLLRLRHYYPDAVIVAMLPTYTASYYSDAKLSQGNAVLAEICAHYGIPCLDLRSSGVTAAHLPDGIHPGAEGMDLITDAVVDLLLSQCDPEAGENVVYSVTHDLSGASASLGYFKGVTHGSVFSESLTGDDLDVTVTMGGKDITALCYADGKITISSVTGDLVITAKGKFNADGHLQMLPEELCCGTNLWSVLEHDKQYYTVDGWGTHNSGRVYSVTFPVSENDRIYATSFGAGSVNGSGGTNGIRVTYFFEDGSVRSLSADTVYREFSANGYLTMPTGVLAVSVPMWTVSDSNELYILNRDHIYENGICAACGAAQWDTDGDGILEILAIGNSFSVDALEYAYQIAQDLGIEEIVLGNLYIGGCSLNTHATNAAGDLAKYTYYYNDNGTWKTTSNYKISTALESRSWDFVSLQQASNYSGVESTYNKDLTNLITYVKERSDAKLVWHMTWAYQQNSTHSAFPTYNKDQMTMYNAIVSAVQNKIVTNSDFDLIVPNGTAVQNSRTSLLGDTTTRDGYHMSYDYGRYLTGLLFIKTVTGLSVDDITYAPSGVDTEEMAIAIESVNNAAAKPFEVTNSAYTGEVPEEGYVLLQSELYKCAYWHPLKAGCHNELIYDQSNSNQFFATIRFTRETLPVGSVIILADGWQYRPDGWVTDTLQTGTREPVTTAPYVVITEEWWGDYTIRSFNISKVGLPSLTNVSEEEVRVAFQIYVPEEKHSHTYENGICALCGAVNPAVIAGTALENFTYILDGENKTVTLTEYTGTNTVVTVPDYYLVDDVLYKTMLRSETVFCGNTKITSVTISGGVGFEDNTMSKLFTDCSALTTVDMTGVDTSEVTSMRSLFNRCKKLTTITGYENWDTGKVESIYMAFNYVFYTSNSKGQLENAVIDLRNWDLSNVKNSGWCFQYCYAEQILLPDSLAVISSGFLNHATKYEGTTFVIPAGVQKIGYGHTIYDFATNDFVEFSVAEGNSHYVAIDGILYSADGTEMLAIPRNKSFDNGIYQIPEGVTFLGELSFSRNNNVTTLILPDSFVIECVEPGDDRYVVFEDLGNLNVGTNLTIAIYNYTGITDYVIKDSNPNYVSIDGIIYSKDKTQVVAIPTRYGRVITLPEGVTTWNKQALWDDTEVSDQWDANMTVDKLIGACGGISLPSTLVDIEADQFGLINRLKYKFGDSFQITVAENNPVYCLTEDGFLAKRPIIITQQPTDAEAALGDNYCVTVEAEGEGLKYQWYFRNAGTAQWYKSSVTDNTYDDVMTTARAGREVYCVITDANGNSVTTDTAKLIRVASEELEIITQPSNGEAMLGETFCVTVEAKGEGLKYQWYYRNAGSNTWNKSGVRDNTYDDVMTTARAGREIYCVITDAYGNSVTTDTVKLIRVIEELEIITQPTNGEAVLGENYCVTVVAKGEGLKYQWYFRNKGAKVWTKSGVTDNTYDDVMTTARADREIYCVITDAYGNKVTTDIVKLVRVPMKLEITSQPTDATAAFDEMFCATVEAKGEGLKYQWYYRNAGSDTWYKSGVRDNTYDDVMTKARNGREIYCVITDAYGNTVTTDIVKLIAVPKVELKLLGQSYESAAMGETYCVTVEAQGEGLTYQWYFRNAGSNIWYKSSVTDNTYDDVMTKARANREVYCVITDAFGNQIVTEVVTLVLTKD